MSRHILGAGVELEGAWDSANRPPGWHTDGSVTARSVWSGEVASPVLPPDDLVEWIQRKGIYPDYINNTCGLHVHLSVSPAKYRSLMDEAFWEGFKAHMKGWGDKEKLEKGHEFWKRLSGKNSFCKATFIPHAQYQHTGKGYERYTQLNYCLGVHGTLECRLLPMFRSKSQAARAIGDYLGFVDDWIEANHDRLEGPSELRFDTAFDPLETEIVVLENAA